MLLTSCHSSTLSRFAIKILTKNCTIFFLFLAGSLSGCGSGDSGLGNQSQLNANFIKLQSDTGDYIGAGRSYEYTQKNSLITITATGGHLSISIRGDEYWNGDFQIPNSLSQLQRGNFNNLQRYPFHDPAVGGLDWYGQGRGCNSLTGSIVIDNVTYAGDVLTAIDLRFVQHCEDDTTALHGQIHWTSTDLTTPPGPVNPPPPWLWQPVPGSITAIGNYVYLQSDMGDFIGQGQTHTYTPSNAVIGISASEGHLAVVVDGIEAWTGDFQTMMAISRLQAGYYRNLIRYPFHNPVKGGLDWYGEGRGCNSVTGWFVVDSVSYAGDVLTAIDLRFEQHCEGDSAALHGQIHWTQ